MAAPRRIFIDGSSGTTGLLIRQLLAPMEKTGQVALLSVPDRRDHAQRRAAFAEADLSVLCLPDEAARGTLALMEGTETRVLDASSAHRVAEGWVYGLPELSPAQPDLIRKARHVSNPGCFATGAISILRPLVGAGVLDPPQTVHITGFTGYTGGGKKTIALYEADGGNFARANACAATSVNDAHKHLPEIMNYAGLAATPVFMPHVVNIPRGMMVHISFSPQELNSTLQEVHEIYQRFYAAKNSRICVAPLDLTDRRVDLSAFGAMEAMAAPQETMEIRVKGRNGQINVFALFDNLGKGAAAQALQNIRLMLSL